MAGWDIAGDIATVATAVVAVFGYSKYLLEKLINRKRLECYLRCQKEAGTDEGQRSIIHLMARTGLTETEIFEASRNSKHIVRRIKSDPETKLAKALLFEYGS